MSEQRGGGGGRERVTEPSPIKIKGSSSKTCLHMRMCAARTRASVQMHTYNVHTQIHKLACVCVRVCKRCVFAVANSRVYVCVCVRGVCLLSECERECVRDVKFSHSGQQTHLYRLVHLFALILVLLALEPIFESSSAHQLDENVFDEKETIEHDERGRKTGIPRHEKSFSCFLLETPVRPRMILDELDHRLGRVN